MNRQGSKKGGAPRADADADDALLELPPATATRHARMHADLVAMLGWIAEVTGQNAADLIDPLVRPQVTARFAEIRPLAIQIAKARRVGRLPEHRKGL